MTIQRRIQVATRPSLGAKAQEWSVNLLTLSLRRHPFPGLNSASAPLALLEPRRRALEEVAQELRGPDAAEALGPRV